MEDLTSKNHRFVCIDRARGFIVFSMVFFQCAERFQSLGLLARIASHTETGLEILPGLMFGDLGAPFFFLIIALNYIPSLTRRITNDGRRKAYTHFVRRYLSIMGFGSCIRIIENVFEGEGSLLTKILFSAVVVTLLAAIFYAVASLFKKGKKAAYIAHNILLRCLEIIGVCILIISIYNVYTLFTYNEFYKCWGVLQSIGGAGLLMLIFAEKKTHVRGIAALVLFGIFSYVHHIPGNMEIIDLEVQGGLVAILSWGSMMLIFSVMADLFYRDYELRNKDIKGIEANSYIIGTIILVVIGVIAAFTMVINKGSVSPGYVLVNLPISAFVFWLFSLTENWKPKFQLFLWWGTSPILMYLFQYITQDIILSLIPGITECGVLLASIYLLGVNGMITLVAYHLYKKGKIIRI